MKFEDLKNYTQARVALGHSGGSIPTKEWLKFAFEHAAAVDAVKIPWELPQNADFKFEILQSKISTRDEYLQRPDLGRLLSETSVNSLKQQNLKGDVLIVVSNGLSSLAVQNHMESFLNCLIPELKSQRLSLLGDKVFLVPNGRVGLIDQIGEILKPKISLMIIGERPGLSSPDSLACYMTYAPKKGLSDANRNCISNIRPPHGLDYNQAAAKTIYLLQESLTRKVSGVDLKDESDSLDFVNTNSII